MTRRYHMVGVAGVGMNALAQALLGKGAVVTGSDRHADQSMATPVLELLRASGVEVFPQDGSGVTADVDALVVSTAIEEDNPDVQQARRLGVPIRHRAELLAGLVEGGRCLAVAGTSGKTTVTGLLGWMLEGLGFDPNVVSGGALINWRSLQRVGNVRLGASNLWVIEADESDRSFLRFSPAWAVINNLSRDHFEMKETRALFGEFAARVADVVFCEDAAMTQLAAPSGWPGNAEWVKVGADVTYDDATGRVAWGGATFHVPLPGRHNLQNAVMAITVCRHWGADDASIQRVLSGFKGMERRLEYVGSVGGMKVFDDYAHNPAKIAAAWTTVQTGAKRVWAVWRPHGYGPLAAMADELAAMFRTYASGEHRLLILPVYYAGGTARAQLTSEAFVARLQHEGIQADYAPDYAWARRRILGEAREGDVTLVMGARDPELPVFARELVASDYSNQMRSISKVNDSRT